MSKRRIAAVLLLAALLATQAQTYAAAEARTISNHIDLARLNAVQFRDFAAAPVGWETTTFLYTYSNGTAAVTASDYSWLYRVSSDRSGSNVFYIALENASITKSGNRISFTIASTNIPPNGPYKAQILGYQTTVTNLARNMGRGSWNVSDSLYDDSGTGYPYPSFNVTNAGDYVTFTALNASSTVINASIVSAAVAASNDVDASVAAAMTTTSNQFVRVDGGNAMTASLNMGGFSVTNVGSSSISFVGGNTSIGEADVIGWNGLSARLVSGLTAGSNNTSSAATLGSNWTSEIAQRGTNYTDSQRTNAITISTNLAASAGNAAYYPLAGNPSNWVTRAEATTGVVIAEADTNFTSWRGLPVSGIDNILQVPRVQGDSDTFIDFSTQVLHDGGVDVIIWSAAIRALIGQWTSTNLTAGLTLDRALNFAGFKGTNMAPGTASNDAANVGQMAASIALATNAITAPGDNLGNHVMTNDIRTAGFWINRGTGRDGLFLSTNRGMSIGTDDFTLGRPFGVYDQTTLAILGTGNTQNARGFFQLGSEQAPSSVQSASNVALALLNTATRFGSIDFVYTPDATIGGGVKATIDVVADGIPPTNGVEIGGALIFNTKKAGDSNTWNFAGAFRHDGTLDLMTKIRWPDGSAIASGPRRFSLVGTTAFPVTNVTWTPVKLNIEVSDAYNMFSGNLFSSTVSGMLQMNGGCQLVNVPAGTRCIGVIYTNGVGEVTTYDETTGTNVSQPFITFAWQDYVPSNTTVGVRVYQNSGSTLTNDNNVSDTWLRGVLTPY